MVLLPSCLDFVCQEACQCRIFRKLSWSIFIILSKDGPLFYFNQRPLSLYCVWNRWTYQEVRLHSPFWKMVEDEDPISPVRTLVHFHILFFIIKASTANQGKRKHLSFFYIHLTANKSNLLFSH
jgi:hypothetical protein